MVFPSGPTLDDAGPSGVRIVDGGDMAQFVPVTVFVREQDGASVGGLPKEVIMIVTGREFVADGLRMASVNKGAQQRP